MQPVVRTILSVDERARTMTFAGDVPVGYRAHLMRSDFERLLDGASGAARATQDRLGQGSPELAILISCRCHIGEIQQVLLNLIVNAAHAIAERHVGSNGRGTVTIRTWEAGVDVLIVIADDGTGIPPQIRDRVFEPFFTTKPIGKGSGQGLSIARAFVVEHPGGTLQLDSELGRVTAFTIRLPIAGKPVVTAAAA